MHKNIQDELKQELPNYYTSNEVSYLAERGEGEELNPYPTNVENRVSS